MEHKQLFIWLSELKAIKEKSKRLKQQNMEE